MQAHFYWILDLNTYQPTKFQQKKSLYEIYMIFLKQLINSASRQVLWGNKSNLLPKHPNQYGNCFFVSKRSLFRQFNFSKSKVKALRFYARLFFLVFRKIVIVLLKCRLSTLEMTIFIFLKDTIGLEGYGD